MSDPTMLTLQGSSAFDKVIYFFETVFTGSATESAETTAKINQLIETTLCRDRDFQTWRKDHPGSHVPDLRRSRARTLRRTTAAGTGGRLSAS